MDITTHSKNFTDVGIAITDGPTVPHACSDYKFSKLLITGSAPLRPLGPVSFFFLRQKKLLPR